MSKPWDPVKAAVVGAVLLGGFALANSVLGNPSGVTNSLLVSPIAGVLGGAFWGGLIAWLRNLFVRSRH